MKEVRVYTRCKGSANFYFFHMFTSWQSAKNKIEKVLSNNHFIGDVVVYSRDSHQGNVCFYKLTIEDFTTVSKWFKSKTFLPYGDNYLAEFIIEAALNDPDYHKYCLNEIAEFGDVSDSPCDYLMKDPLKFTTLMFDYSPLYWRALG